ncbi:MAG TPA: 2-succinyl-5-enolpyruvyl-6-hydroxy-3-cyclohexene-1-carboxylic-acid synthase, partial [Myxococcota bacterium]|nr:2-succinyl-5-enolpyruvyl-6-hydroxy-3-cyclohexene-1-carboxylic-acid synthase [Myxococcota bacterium]
MSKAFEVSGGASARAFSSDPVAVYRFVDAFFDSLCAAGVEHVVVSPGSRSTPLALGAERTPGLRTWVQLDERSAGFFALGIAKASRRPVALVCTSGTAAANYLPAVVEAHYTRAPLVVLTADRPPELRDWGVGQTIDQPGLYGRYPRWTVEVPIPAAGEDALRYARRLAARAAERARGEPAGPVHLNWPLREPLEPPNGGPPRITPDRADDPGLRFSRAELVATDADVEALLDRVRSCERGLICVGPIDAEPAWCDAVRRFAEISGWPLLADPASSLRSGGVAESILTMGDAFTRAPGFVARMQPELVLRLGATPVSKAQRLWLEGASPDEVWWLDEGGDWGEPSHRATRVVRGGAASLLERVARAVSGPIRGASPWLRELTRAEASARRAFEDWVGEERSHGARATSFSGLSAVRRIVEALPPRARLFASNSM